MIYRITIARSAEKELSRIASTEALRIEQSIDRLAHTPRPSGCKKLRGSRDLWRIRVGDYRVVYAIDDAVRIVSIERIGHRGEVYD